MNTDTIIAEWRSKSGKYFATLTKFASGSGYQYQGDKCGGSIPGNDDAAAIAEVQKYVDRGHFQPDANKTPMKRIK